LFEVKKDIFIQRREIRFIGGFGERVQKVVQGVVIVICESSRCSTRASHFLLPEEPTDFVAQGSH